MIDPNSELQALVDILAEWAGPVPRWKIYLFGSRVRGDHRQDSDVDIAVDWGNSGQDDQAVEWWLDENDSTDFKEINAKLPGRLHIIRPDDDPVWHDRVKSGPVVYQKGNIYCVLLPAKTS